MTKSRKHSMTMVTKSGSMDVVKATTIFLSAGNLLTDFSGRRSRSALMPINPPTFRPIWPTT